MSRPETPEASFLTIVYTMATQAMIALGQIPNPITQQKIADERQARWHLRSLEILAEKTQGNLDAQEQSALDAAIKELKLATKNVEPESPSPEG